MKPIEKMTAGEINRLLDRLDKDYYQLMDEFIAQGRGDERPSEWLGKDDALSQRAKHCAGEYHLVRVEMERRYGPNPPARLPRGCGPVRAP